MRITIPSAFTSRYHYILRQYLSDDRQLNRDAWQLLYQGIDVLGNARIQIGQEVWTFHQAYQRYIDAHLASTYLKRLLTLTNFETQPPMLIADFARQIAPHLQQAGLLRSDIPQTWLFYVYCIYWWQNFARGYAFEVQVMRDLRASGIAFYTHDILDPVERRSAADLIVLDLAGDVKTSTYFLRQVTSRGLSADFYVTRLWTGQRQRLLVVFQKPTAWEKINGDTIEGELSDVLHLLPRPTRLRQDNVVLIVIDYETWKQRVLKIQSKETHNE